MRLSFTKNSNIVLIDAGYFMFYRYYATLKWYSFKYNNEINIEDLHNTREFIEALENHTMKDLEKLKKRWSTKNVVFCLDTKREMIWRMKHYPQYKSNRNNESINKLALKHMIPFIQDYELAQFVGTDHLEADDIAYILTEELLNNEDFKHNIIIITNDNDYLQMIRDRVEIYNLQGKDGGVNLSSRSNGRPEVDLMIKILKGDTSDFILPIYTRLGIETAKRIAMMSEEDRLEWIKSKGEQAIQNYNNNKLLIDFKEIPNEYKEEFLSNLELIFR